MRCPLSHSGRQSRWLGAHWHTHAGMHTHHFVFQMHGPSLPSQPLLPLLQRAAFHCHPTATCWVPALCQLSFSVLGTALIAHHGPLFS